MEIRGRNTLKIETVCWQDSLCSQDARYTDVRISQLRGSLFSETRQKYEHKSCAIIWNSCLYGFMLALVCTEIQYLFNYPTLFLIFICVRFHFAWISFLSTKFRSALVRIDPWREEQPGNPKRLVKNSKVRKRQRNETSLSKVYLGSTYVRSRRDIDGNKAALRDISRQVSKTGGLFDLSKLSSRRS